MPDIDLATIRQATEGRDGNTLGALYAEDAVLQVIDQMNPPSHPKEIRGRAAIQAYFDDVCGRDMTHRVEDGIAAGDRISFTQRCAYPDGKAVVCATTLELAGGKISRQVAVQAWDS
jgi:ketosteroid isomerase-like protein